MRSQRAWSLVALLFAACAIPDVEVVSSLESDAGASSTDGSGESDQGGSSNGTGTAGGSNGTGKGGSSNGTGKGGGEPSNTAGDATGGDTTTGGTTTGGTTTGGTTGAGGKATGGSGGSRPSGGSSGTGGASGTGGTSGAGGTSGSAVGKFCSDINYNGASIVLHLEVGSGANKVTFVTGSQTCSPIVPNACTPIPSGTAVPLVLVDPNTNPPTPLATTTLKIVAGETWIFWAGFTTAPYIDFDNTYTPAECKADNFAIIASGA
jgi:hypothetical protein